MSDDLSEEATTFEQCLALGIDPQSEREESDESDDEELLRALAMSNAPQQNRLPLTITTPAASSQNAASSSELMDPHEPKDQKQEEEKEQEKEMKACDADIDIIPNTPHAPPQLDCKINLVAPGDSIFLQLPCETYKHRILPAIAIEHGSSLSLISRGTMVLNEMFENVDPAKSWNDWTKVGVQPYFMAVVGGPGGARDLTNRDRDKDRDRSIHSVLRFLIDGDVESGHVLNHDVPGNSPDNPDNPDNHYNSTKSYMTRRYM